MDEAGAADAQDAAGPSQSQTRTTKPSRHHLEPNPFEQSFSSKPSHQRSASPENTKSSKGGKKIRHKATKSESGIKPEETSGEEQDATLKGDEASRTNEPSTPSATQTPSKRILPPVSSIASPALHENNTMQYPWSSSLTGSLRSGPLSPAMLAGPQSNFNVSNFRSGFTPDISTFKTGLTPLGASSTSFPPPSPNTAAFLAMVTNSSGQGLSGATITPNTLSALSGNPMDTHANGHSLLSSQPGNNGEKGSIANHGDHHDQFDFAFGRSMQDTPTKGGNQNHAGMKLRKGLEGQNTSSDFADSQSGPNANYRQQNQQQTTQAASGLFLLSQAHQELSKREDAANAAAAAAQNDHGIHSMNGHQLYSSGDVSNGQRHPDGKGGKNGIVTNAKRKKSAEPMNAIKGTSIKKMKPASKIEDMPAELEGYESDEIDEDGNRKQKSSDGDGGDGGDGEEKRKNFLERNRQAALKCRQRKKAWLASLQAKVEYLQSDNENLQGSVSALRNEVMFLKSQLMQAQRQMSQHPGTNLGQNSMEVGVVGVPSGPAPTLGRNSISGPVPMQGVGNGIHLGSQTPQQQMHHQQSNIDAMAAAAAAANNNGGTRMGATPGQYQAHAVPRPTHIPGQPSNPQYIKNHARQSSAQAA